MGQLSEWYTIENLRIISAIFHALFFYCHWPQVTHTAESKTADKEGNYHTAARGKKTNTDNRAHLCKYRVNFWWLAPDLYYRWGCLKSVCLSAAHLTSYTLGSKIQAVVCIIMSALFMKNIRLMVCPYFLLCSPGFLSSLIWLSNQMRYKWFLPKWDWGFLETKIGHIFRWYVI